MKKHVNIPVFIPHLGCPNQCVFCNQHTISGVDCFKPESVVEIIEEALTTVPRDASVEIAFFGGSFTGIDRNLMIELLEIGYSYIKQGRVTSLRCSTRPDYINDEILVLLKKYGVRVIELGLQSVDNRVLALSKRGHDFSYEENACRKIVDFGFELVGQMMIGLPGATQQSEIDTANFIISAGAVGARIYPTVVFKDTELCEMANSGEYVPLSVEEAVERSAAVMKKFIDADIDVIRIGLCASENLADENTYHSGPNHPAVGELVINEIYYKIVKEELEKLNLNEKANISVLIPRGSLSKVIGQKKKNRLRLMREFPLLNISFSESDSLSEYSVSIER